MSIPTDNTDYSRREYWDSRFQGEDKYDWLCGLEAVKGLLIPLIPDKKSSILIIGCGNSGIFDSKMKKLTET